MSRVGASVAVAATQTASWLTGGQNLDNSRYQPNESAINSGNVSTLAAKFAFTAGGDVSATPAIDGQRVYFPDSAGNLFAIDRSTGATIWTASISAMSQINVGNGATGNDYARATPAIAGQVLIIGTQSGKFQTPAFAAERPDLAGGYVLGLNKNTGELLWRTKVHDHFAAFVTQSAQVNGNTAYVGVASNEEAFSNQDLSGGIPYTCCSFRGRFLALDTNTGAIKWATYTLPDDEGYSGAPVWGSTPAIDKQRGAVYITTGNNYSLPADRITCVDEAATFEAKQACLAGDNFDAIMSLDMQTGAINWSYTVRSLRCVEHRLRSARIQRERHQCPATVPENAGPDYDFGQGADAADRQDRWQAGRHRRRRSRAAIFTVLDRNTGVKLWVKNVGPGGLLGGLQWGSATDGKRIYVAESNSSFDDTPGWWSALDPATGNELWRPSTRAQVSAANPAASPQGAHGRLSGSATATRPRGPSRRQTASSTPARSTRSARNVRNGRSHRGHQVELREWILLPRRGGDRERHRLLGHGLPRLRTTVHSRQQAVRLHPERQLNVQAPQRRPPKRPALGEMATFTAN